MHIDKTLRWILFLINPFIAMLLAFKEYTLAQSKNIFWAFCVFYGLSFAIAEESMANDITRYIADLQYFYSLNQLTISGFVSYFQLSGELDILSALISFILSRFTDNYAILTMVYAFIFGYFFSRNIWYVLNLVEGKLNIFIKILILGLILVMPIWMINGFRMWTAFHIFVYGLLPYIFENKKNKLIFLLLSFFVHFSYIIPISVFIIYWIFGNRIRIYFFLFIFSLFISEINIGFINNMIENYLPEVLVERTYSYRNEEIIDARKEQSASSNVVWYVRWQKKLLKLSFYLFIIYYFLFVNPLNKFSPELQRLFAISLLFFSVGNILSNIPSGGRFINLPIFLTFIMLILYFNQNKNDYRSNLLAQILLPSLMLFIIVSLRIGLFSTSITTIMGNPIITMFNAGKTMSLNDVIK